MGSSYPEGILLGKIQILAWTLLHPYSAIIAGILKVILYALLIE